MTPKEKAEELTEKFRKTIPRQGSLHVGGRKHMNRPSIKTAKQCALTAVDEIIERITKIKFYSEINFLQEMKYWREVKNEIEKL